MLAKNPRKSLRRDQVGRGRSSALLVVALLAGAASPAQKPVAPFIDDSNPRIGEAANQLSRTVTCRRGPTFLVKVRDGRLLSVQRDGAELPGPIAQASTAFGNAGVVGADVACHAKGSYLLLTAMRGRVLASLLLPNAAPVSRP